MNFKKALLGMPAVAALIALSVAFSGADGRRQLVSAPSRSLFGIDVEHISEDRADAVLDRIQESGASWIRLYALWLHLEPNPPDPAFKTHDAGTLSGKHIYKWDYLDKLVDAARRRGIEVYLTNIWPPRWANGASATCNPFVGKDLSCGNLMADPAWLEDFVFNEVAHFKGRVRYYGLWNEPNDRHEFNGPADAAYLKEFMRLYAFPSRRALLAADHDAKLVGPELSMGTGVPNGKAKWHSGWIEPIVRDYPGVFDVISIHNHSNRALNAEARARKALSIMARHRSSAELWITEYGVSTCNVSEAKQASQIELVYKNAPRIRELTKIFYYTITDLDGEKCGAGLLSAYDRGFVPRPAFYAFKKSVTEAARK